MSSSVGSGLRSSSHRAVSIMPGVQKPHWSPWQRANPSWTGSSSPPRARPSTVRTRCPSAIAARTVHDFTGCPSSQMTQAPQFEVSQPQCEPVSPRSSLMKWMSNSRGSIVREYSVPLTFTAICTSGSLDCHASCHGRPRERGAQRSPGQLAREVALVVRGPALVGNGPAVPGGDLPGGREAFLGCRRSAQVLLGLRGGEVLRADRGQPDPGVGDGGAVAFEPDRRAGGADRPVPDPPPDLLIRAPAAGGDRDLDLGEQLARRDDRLVGPRVEVSRAYGPCAFEVPDDHGGLQ